MSNKTADSIYGTFASEWKLVRLKDICVSPKGVQTGPFGSQLHQRDYQQFGTPIITVEHLGDNRILHQDLPRVSDSDYQRLNRYTLTTGDIVFSRVGSVDRRALVRKSENGWLFSSRCLRVRPNPKYIDSSYLSYFFGLPSFKEHIRRIAVGATMPSLNTSILSDLDIILPPLPEQKAIAHILGTLDDKIELNQQMNQTLEAMARAIFKSWFVDFEPVRAKMEGKQPVGMDTATANLFPNSFEESELGLIPNGWRVGTFANLAEINKGDIVDGPFGSNLKSSDYTETGIRLIHQENIQEFRFIDDKQRFTSYKKAETLQRSVAYPNDIVLTKMPDPITRATIIPKGIADRFIIMADCIRVRPYEDITPNTYLLYLINNPLFRQEALSRATGTTRLRINLTQLKSIQVIIAPISVRLAFNKLVETLEKKRETIYHESRTLANIRDTLLPKLMSGEIRVKEAETMIEEVI